MKAILIAKYFQVFSHSMSCLFFFQIGERVFRTCFHLDSPIPVFVTNLYARLMNSSSFPFIQISILFLGHAGASFENCPMIYYIYELYSGTILSGGATLATRHLG